MNRSQLMERALRQVVGSQEIGGIATSGSTTTIVDTVGLQSVYQNGKFKNWLIFIRKSTDGLAPQSEYGVGSTFSRTTGTITLRSALTAAVGAGDEYAAFKSPVNLYRLQGMADEALSYFGYSFISLDTSLTTAASTLNYTLPTALKGININHIYLRDSDLFQHEAPEWYIDRAAPGSSDTLKFHTYPAQGYTICIQYSSQHSALSSYSDVVDPLVPDRLAILSLQTLIFKVMAFPRQRDKDMKNWRNAEADLQKAQRETPIRPRPERQQFLKVSHFNSGR